MSVLPSAPYTVYLVILAVWNLEKAQKGYVHIQVVLRIQLYLHLCNCVLGEEKISAPGIGEH